MSSFVMESSRAVKAHSYQQITAGGLATPAGLTFPEGTVYAEVIVSGQAVRWRADGPPPTTAIGMPMAVGERRIFALQSLAPLLFIEQVAGAVLDVTYYSLS